MSHGKAPPRASYSNRYPPPPPAAVAAAAPGGKHPAAQQPSYGLTAAPIRMQATPAWADTKPPPLRARCSGLRWAVWGTVVVLIIAAAVGLSVTMVMVHKNRDDGSSGGGGGDGGDSSGGHNGGGSTGGGGGGTPSEPGQLGTPPFEVPAGWTALWWDEFDGTTLDTSKWSYDLGNGDWGWGNGENQTYTNSEANVRVANGSLAITALRSRTGAWTSGRINTLGIAAFYPGMVVNGVNYSTVRIEGRIRLPPPGQGLWPAFWGFPVQEQYGKWPASGEIDIMESINAMTSITHGIHYGGPYPTANVMTMSTSEQPGLVPWSNAFHVFDIDWASDNMAWSIDSAQVMQMWSRSVDPAGGWYTTATGAGPNAPFDAPFYLIINLAVGGLFPTPPDSTTPASSTMLVDYIRVLGR